MELRLRPDMELGRPASEPLHGVGLVRASLESMQSSDSATAGLSAIDGTQARDRAPCARIFCANAFVQR